jgi:hypothetical protein
MGFFTKIKLAWQTVSLVCELAKRADATVTTRFSDEWWAELRKNIENWLYDLHTKADKGIWALFDFDNQLLRGAMILFKSDRLAQIEHAEPRSLGRRVAVAKLREKDRRETLDQITARFSGPKQY